MRRVLVQTILLFGCLGVPVACSTPGPSPAEWAAQVLPVVELDPATRAEVTALTAQAMQALNDQQPTEAASLTERVLRLDPRAARARAILGIALLAPALAESPPDLTWMERAEGELRLARRLDPEDPEVAMLYAKFLEFEGQISLAAAVIDQLIAVQPGHLRALRHGSRLHFELGRERRAAVLLDRLVAERPTEAAARYRLALCQESLAAAIERGDTNLDKGVDAAARAAFLRAAESYRIYTRLQPRDVQGFLGEATARFRAVIAVKNDPNRQAGLAEVQSLLSTAARIDPTDPAPLHNRALVHAQVGDQALARADYEAALRRDKDYLPSILNLAQLLDANGEVDAARDFCRRALTLKPNDDEVKRLRAYLASK